VRLDLYTDGEAPQGTRVTMALTKAGEPRAMISGAAKLTTGRTGVTRAEAAFPLASLTPGAYTITATIFVNGTIGAEVTSRIRIR